MIRKLTPEERAAVLAKSVRYFRAPSVVAGGGPALLCVRMRAAGFRIAGSCVGECFRIHHLRGVAQLATALETVEIVAT